MGHSPDAVPRLGAYLWWGDVLLFSLSAVVIVLSFVLQPSTEALSVFGWEVPPICAFRNLFGVSCPGCGMSRSFTFLAHGDVGGAFHMNYIGPFLYVLVASQIPYRGLKVVRGLRAHAAARAGR